MNHDEQVQKLTARIHDRLLELLGKEILAIINAIYPLQLEVDFPIHILPVDERRFKAQEFGLYRTAQKEGRLV